MASTPFSTFCHFHKPTLLFLASDGFRLGGAPAIAFGKVRKNRKMGIFPVCRAGSAVVFRDLDADDFRHPLDQQVRPISPFFLPFWIDFSIYTYKIEKKNELSFCHELKLTYAPNHFCKTLSSSLSSPMSSINCVSSGDIRLVGRLRMKRKVAGWIPW